MTAAFALRTLLELGVVLLIIYGLFHEKALVRLEDRVLHAIARRIRRGQRSNRAHAAAVRGASPKTHRRAAGSQSGPEPRRVA